MTRPPVEIASPRVSPFAMIGGMLVQVLPIVTLFGVMLRAGGKPPPLLVGGIATVAFLAFGLLQQVGAARAASHKTASPIYLITVLILWLTAKNANDFFLQVAMGTMVGVPLFLFIIQEFLFTGGGSQRRAKYLVRRLAAKNDWPSDLAACKSLPEVKALREALREDAEPVLVLLMNPKPQVRIAALAALEFRPSWRKGQAETVLQAAKFATEPPVRSAALMALANVDDSNLATTVAIYLRDPSPEVRKAAAEAVLWDAERRWTNIRREIRAALGDPRCLEDGPLPLPGTLPAIVMIDLTMWAGENGAIGVRSTRTLLAHYHRELNQNPSSELMHELAGRVRDNRVPSSLRVELAHLLTHHNCVNENLWRSMLEAGQPSALRLMAAGALLREGKDEKALETLREVACVPNREMALQVASIVQQCLRIDMGLPLGGALPEPQSKLAAEVARKVIEWAEGKEQPRIDDRSSRRTRISSIVRNLPKGSGDFPRRRV